MRTWHSLSLVFLLSWTASASKTVCFEKYFAVHDLWLRLKKRKLESGPWSCNHSNLALQRSRSTLTVLVQILLFAWATPLTGASGAALTPTGSFYFFSHYVSGEACFLMNKTHRKVHWHTLEAANATTHTDNPVPNSSLPTVSPPPVHSPLDRRSSQTTRVSWPRSHCADKASVLNMQ